MDSFIKDLVFSIYDNDLIKTKDDLQLFLKKFIKTLQNFDYDSIDLTITSSESEEEIEPTTSDEDFIDDNEYETESSDNENLNLNENIFICDICKKKNEL